MELTHYTKEVLYMAERLRLSCGPLSLYYHVVPCGAWRLAREFLGFFVAKAHDAEHFLC